MAPTSQKPAATQKRLISDFFSVEKKARGPKSAQLEESTEAEKQPEKERKVTKKEDIIVDTEAAGPVKATESSELLANNSESGITATFTKTKTIDNNTKSTDSGPQTTARFHWGEGNPKTGLFDTQKWALSLAPETRELLDLEIRTLHESWLALLHKEITKPYFLQLKRFLQAQKKALKTVFPPEEDIYSWSHYTPLANIKCLVLGQDPYHNYNQAHGLAFSVLEPTKPPPLLVNIYKALLLDFPGFQVPNAAELARKGTPGGGNLTCWAKRGVLMLNAVLTVEAHKANSHAGKGWETFTEAVIKAAINHHRRKAGFVIMAWGSPAQKRVQKLGELLKNFHVIKSVHPLPLSAHRGWFELKVFLQCNEWLVATGREGIDWGVIKSVLE